MYKENHKEQKGLYRQKLALFFRSVIMKPYKNKLRSVDELPHAQVPKKRVAPTLQASGPSLCINFRSFKYITGFFILFLCVDRTVPEKHYIWAAGHGIILIPREGKAMQFFAVHLAPWILYGCSIVLVPLGIRRLRGGSPLKGMLDLLGAGVIAVMAWTLRNP